MSTSTPVPFDRARSLSRWIARFMTVIVIGIPVAFALSSAGFLFLYDRVDMQLNGFPQDTPPFLTLGQRLLLVGALLLTVAPPWIAATHVRRLFRTFSRDEVFTAHNVARLRAIGAWLLISVLMANVGQLLFIAITRPPEPAFDLMLVPAVYAAMIYVIAYVLEEATRIADEHRKFV